MWPAASLTYTWTTTGNPPAAVGFSNNGTNAAKNTTATFHKAGACSFQVTITNAAGLSTTSNVNVTVGQTTTMVGITPAAPTVVSGAPLQLTAFIGDQFGNPMGSQPTAWTWSVSGGGTITSTGLYTPPYASGTAVVQATAANMTGWAQVTFSGPAEWGSAASGSWSGGWNNTSTAAPGTRGIAGDTVVLAASGGAAVRLDGASPHLAGITFDGSGGYSIVQGSGGTLHLDNGAAAAQLTVVQGNDAIGAPLRAQQPLARAAQGSTWTSPGRSAARVV